MQFSKEFVERIFKAGLLLVIILVIADLLTFFFHPDTVFGDIFLATREQTPLTWISSLAFLFIALPCFSAYLETKKKIWFFLSLVFFFFSMDDAVYLHERLSGFFVDNTEIFGFFPSYVWVVLYLPVLFFALGALIFLLWKKSLKRRPIIIALVLLGFAISLDFVDGFVQKQPELVFCFEKTCNLIVIHLMRLCEEILEVLALGILAFTAIKQHCIANKKH